MKQKKIKLNRLKKIQMTLKNFSFPVGFAIKHDYFNANYLAKFDTEARSITAENAMKFDGLQPKKGEFDFRSSDYVVNFAEARNIRVHGHTLIWAHNDATPAWVEAYEGTVGAREEAIKILTAHITKVVSTYAGRIEGWDVVNEAFDEKGNWADCFWLRVIGKDYFKIAFQAAAAADPNCKLFYNGYGLETGNETMFNNLMEQKSILDAANIPFHGVGFQMHTYLDERMEYFGRNMDTIRKRLRTYSDKKFLIHISELDISTYKISPTYTPELASKLATYYSDIFEAYEKVVDPSLKYGITMWAVSDNDTFLNRGDETYFPMLFDTNYQPKEAYFKVLNLLSPLPNDALIYQDFELKEMSSSQFEVTSTGGTLPSAWTMVSRDSAARAKVNEMGLVMAQTQVDVFNHILVDAQTPNYTLSTRTGFVYGNSARVMHLAFRFVDRDNLFSVQAYKSATEDVWRLVKRSNGIDTVLHTSTIKPAWGQFVSVTCNGAKISYSIDGKVQARIVDNSFESATQVGFKMKGFYNADKYSSWKFIKVDPIPQIADDFAFGPIGNANGRPTNSGTVPKSWVVNGSSAVFNGMEVTAEGLRATGGTATSYSNALIDSGASNYKLSAMLAKTKSENTLDRTAIILFRVKDNSNFYYLLVNNTTTTDKKWVLTKRDNGVNTVLITSPFDAKDGDRVTILANGGVIKLYVNDIFVDSIIDGAFLTEKKIGFRGRGQLDNYSTWSDIQLKYLT
jgi:endo-1,4-beta-xylanase